MSVYHVYSYNPGYLNCRLNSQSTSVSPSEISRLQVRFASAAQKSFSEFVIKLKYQTSYYYITKLQVNLIYSPGQKFSVTQKFLFSCVHMCKSNGDKRWSKQDILRVFWNIQPYQAHKNSRRVCFTINEISLNGVTENYCPGLNIDGYFYLGLRNWVANKKNYICTLGT